MCEHYSWRRDAFAGHSLPMVSVFMGDGGSLARSWAAASAAALAAAPGNGGGSGAAPAQFVLGIEPEHDFRFKGMQESAAWLAALRVLAPAFAFWTAGTAMYAVWPSLVTGGWGYTAGWLILVSEVGRRCCSAWRSSIARILEPRARRVGAPPL